MSFNSNFLVLAFLAFFVLFLCPNVLEAFNGGEEGTKLPISNYEPDYIPQAWNSDEGVMNRHNCYAYFLDDLDTNRKSKPQPGYYYDINEKNKKNKYKNCSELERKILNDNPSVYISEEYKPCNQGYYKGFLALDPNKDYHFYRQDSNGLFSHKPGKYAVTNRDASGNLIYNPKNADRDHEHFNYSVPCSFFCIPANGTKTTNSI